MFIPSDTTKLVCDAAFFFCVQTHPSQVIDERAQHYANDPGPLLSRSPELSIAPLIQTLLKSYFFPFRRHHHRG